MKKTLFATALTAGLMGLTPALYADDVNFYELTSQDTVKKFSKSNVPVTYQGLEIKSGQGGVDSVDRPLTVAHFGDELGLGVCGGGDDNAVNGSLCASGSAFDTELGTGTWDGQLDELENDPNREYIRISEIDVQLTGEFKLGSFDGSEAGNITFTDGTTNFSVTFQRDGAGGKILADNTGGVTTITQDSGNVFTLIIGNFDTSKISQVVFRAGCGTGATDCGTDNDYLVASASVVPIPAAAWLFGSAMLGLLGIGRRRSAKAAG